jgi:uncharacterized iron-regulated protein
MASKFSSLFGRRSAVIIGMIHVDALPGICMSLKDLNYGNKGVSLFNGGRATRMAHKKKNWAIRKKKRDPP